MIATDMTSDKAQQKKNTATTTAKTTPPEKSTPGKRVASKPAPRRPAKPASKSVAKPVSKPAKDQKTAKKGKALKNAKPKNAKMVRDSFTMPELEYELIAAVKRRCIANGLAVKKSEVLRAAIIGFAALSDSAVAAALKALLVIKTGRPANGK
jgi:hypothetical protein